MVKLMEIRKTQSGAYGLYIGKDKSPIREEHLLFDLFMFIFQQLSSETGRNATRLDDMDMRLKAIEIALTALLDDAMLRDDKAVEKLPPTTPPTEKN